MFYINYPNPNVSVLPILISVPHCGTEIPPELVGKYKVDKIEDLDDTDWFLQDLYSFAADMGIMVVFARYHRWVIDLNRQPDAKPLYTDGRVITGLVPTTDFLGNPIYNEGQEPNEAEIGSRLAQYFVPYHQEIEKQLTKLQNLFPHVLLYDAHSIRQFVPSIRPTAFPDMILGTNDGASAHPELIATALAMLRTGKYQVNHNDPFKGGYITRHFGQPSQNRHAIQLERAKIYYMQDDERQYSRERASEMQQFLKNMLHQLAQVLLKLD